MDSANATVYLQLKFATEPSLQMVRGKATFLRYLYTSNLRQ